MGGSIKQEASERIKAFRGFLLSLSKNYPIGPVSGIIEETGVFSWKTGEKTHGASRSL